MEKFRKLKKAKRGRKHGFLARSKNRSGKKVLGRKRRKSKMRLTV